MVGIAVASGGGIAVGQTALRSAGAYAWMKRLYMKFGEGAADQLARQAITDGAAHEEYELSTKPAYYEDTFEGTFRGVNYPTTYRRMWIDPVTFAQRFETHRGGSLLNREPFYYVLHNREYSCTSSGDPNNSYDFKVSAKVEYWLRDRVVKQMVGHEVFFHPVRYEMGLNLTPAGCYDTRPLFRVDQKASHTVPRDNAVSCEPFFKNADVLHLIAWYDLAK